MKTIIKKKVKCTCIHEFIQGSKIENIQDQVKIYSHPVKNKSIKPKRKNSRQSQEKST